MSDIRDDYLKFRVDDDEIKKESFMSTAIKVLVIILLLLLLVVLGAVAYKFLFADNNKQVATVPVQKIQPTPEPVVEAKPVQTETKTQNNNLVSNVTAAVEQKSEGIKKEEIALIVKSVLAQMNKTKKEPAMPKETVKQSTPQSSSNTTTVKPQEDDAALLNDLKSADIDNVQEEDMDLSALDNIDSNKQVHTNNKKADTFNKVIIDKKEVTTKDDLTKLYAKLNNIMKKDKKKVKTSSYVSKIKKETKVRHNAMRIITVRKGDTLSLIAERAYGNAMAYPKIFAANPDLIKNPNRIYPGQKLRVPKE